MTHIEGLLTLARRLTSLLEDPHPGLISWRDQLENVIEGISEYSAFPVHSRQNQ